MQTRRRYDRRRDDATGMDARAERRGNLAMAFMLESDACGFQFLAYELISHKDALLPLARR